MEPAQFLVVIGLTYFFEEKAMSISYPKSPRERHLREHTESLLFWTVGVLAVVGMVSFVYGIQSQQHLASNPLAATTGPAMPVPPS